MSVERENQIILIALFLVFLGAQAYHHRAHKMIIQEFHGSQMRDTELRKIYDDRWAEFIRRLQNLEANIK